jgi:PhoH-like ATPase
MPDADVKTFVLDTNVLLHNPRALFAFAENQVVIPMTVLEELDKFKTANNELGRNAREVARSLDRLRDIGSLRQGVQTEHGGMVQVILRFDEISELLPGLNDNRIIGCAHLMRREGRRVVFISKDINARLKADALGIPSEDFENQKIDIKDLPDGWREIVVEPEAFSWIESNETLRLEDLDMELEPTQANQFLIIRTTDPDAGMIAFQQRPHCEELHRLPDHIRDCYGIQPRNIEQAMALQLLTDDAIRLVTLVGSAGTGKTLLALATGMHKVLQEQIYSKLLVSRPIMPLGKDIGYLPGSKDEKMTHWMGPIFDNLHFILAAEESEPDEVIRRLLEDGTITMEALTYIRGRSISRHYLIVDEAQNLTPHEVKTIISRAGEGTKVILTGDPNQIDNPYLDASSNGLTYTVKHLYGEELFGHITLQTSERSRLAALAVDKL